MSSEDLIVRQYRNRVRKRVLSTLLVGLILSVLVVLDIQIGSSSLALTDLVDAVLLYCLGNPAAHDIYVSFCGCIPKSGGTSNSNDYEQSSCQSLYARCDCGCELRRSHRYYDRLCSVRSNLAWGFDGSSRYGADGVSFHFLSWK